METLISYLTITSTQDNAVYDFGKPVIIKKFAIGSTNAMDRGIVALSDAESVILSLSNTADQFQQFGSEYVALGLGGFEGEHVIDDINLDVNRRLRVSHISAVAQTQPITIWYEEHPSEGITSTEERDLMAELRNVNDPDQDLVAGDQEYQIRLRGLKQVDVS